MLKIGLTGGIGSGKSTVARLFSKRGVPVLDADKVARDLVNPGQPALQAIVEQFGPEILDQHGRLDRAKLRHIVFHSLEQKQRLEAILHPLVYQALEREAARLDAPYCILCIPLLLETGGQHRVDRILVVDCPEELQYARVKQRDQLSDEEVKRILAVQASRNQRRAAADDILTNDADLQRLEAQVEKIHRFYLSLS